MRTGGFCASMVRICTGDVCVRSTMSVRALDVERVLHVARGMILRDRERFEVVAVGLDLRALGDHEAELREDLLDLAPHDASAGAGARGDARAPAA